VRGVFGILGSCLNWNGGPKERPRRLGARRVMQMFLRATCEFTIRLVHLAPGSLPCSAEEHLLPRGRGVLGMCGLLTARSDLEGGSGKDLPEYGA
jgi:hypothetical protein